MGQGAAEIPGTKLENDDPAIIGGFTLLKRIGAGRQAVTYLGRDPHDSVAAVKVLRPEQCADERAVEAFEKEASILGLVPNTFSPRLYDEGSDGACRYLIMEYMDGRSLAQIITDHGPYTGDDLRNFAIEITRIVATLHEKGIHHGDIKPRHLILGPAGRVFLIDFGVADIDDIQLWRRDMFCLAAVIHYAAGGRFPYEGTPLELATRAMTARVKTANLPPKWRDPLRACLDPKNRNCPNAVDVLAAVSR